MFGLHWFDITMDMSMRKIGWVWLILLIAVIFVAFSSRKLWNEGFRIRLGPNRCRHIYTRCLHGDEILHHMKVYLIRWRKESEMYRQVCLECGAALDRTAICTATGEDLHEWEGPWPYDERMVQG